MGEIRKYDDAVEIIKRAILQSQYDAARQVNEKQLVFLGSFSYHFRVE